MSNETGQDREKATSWRRTAPNSTLMSPAQSGGGVEPILTARERSAP